MQRPGTKNHDAIADALAPVRRTLTNDASIERSRRHRSCLLLAGVPNSQKSNESGHGPLRAPLIAGAGGGSAGQERMGSRSAARRSAWRANFKEWWRGRSEKSGRDRGNRRISGTKKAGLEIDSKPARMWRCGQHCCNQSPRSNSREQGSFQSISCLYGGWRARYRSKFPFKERPPVVPECSRSQSEQGT